MAEFVTAQPKDPNAIIDYSFDWTELYNETIADHQVTVPAGITLVSSDLVNGVVFYRLSGGTAGETYDVVLQITTAAGQVDERTVQHPVEER